MAVPPEVTMAAASAAASAPVLVPVNAPVWFRAMWSIFEQTGPLANILGILIPAISVGGWLLGLVLLRRVRRDNVIKQHLDKVKGDLELDVIKKKQELHNLEQVRHGLEERLASTVTKRIDESRLGGGGAEQAAELFHEWLETEGSDISALLVKHAKSLLGRATGPLRGPGLWVAYEILIAAEALDPHRKSSPLADDIRALISKEGHSRPRIREAAALMREQGDESFDMDAVGAAVRLADEAQVHLNEGQYAAAREFAAAAESIFVANVGHLSKQAMDCRRIRAETWLNTGDYGEALEGFDALVKQYAASTEFGPAHPKTIEVELGKVSVMLDMFRYEESLSEIDRILELIPPSETTSSEILKGQTLRARALEGVGLLQEARDLFDKTLEGFDTSPDYGATHPITLACRFQRISVLQALGLHPLCLSEIDELLTIYRDQGVWPPTHPKMLLARQMRAHVLHFLGLFDESIREHRLLAAEYEASPNFGACNHHTLMCRESLAGELLRVGDHVEALAELDFAITTRSSMENFGPRHAITLLSRRMRASLLASLDRLDEALDALDELIEDQAESLGMDDTETLDTIEFRQHIRHRWQQKHSGANFSGIGRNEICPCGSGEKFKNCHGKLA